MPFANIVVKPGVDVQSTPTLTDGRWNASQLIRFKDSMVQKLGGWSHLTATPVIGTATGMHAWADLNENIYLSIGTDQRLMVYSTSGLNDVTPLRASDPTNNSAVNFSTVIGTPNVTIIDANCTQLVSAGDTVQIVNPIAVGGLVLQGFYMVNAVTNVTTYTITAQANATATVNNGGATAHFVTTNASSTITVTLNNHGYSPTSIYNVYISTTVATVVLLGQYLVQTVTNANVFTITAGSNANANASGDENGGLVRINYLIPSGGATSVAVSGYGSGTYGSGTYGVGGSSPGLFTEIRQWSLDNWGQQLIASYTAGVIYLWDPTGGYVPATVVSGAPTKSHSIAICNPAQILISFGSEPGSGTQDHLLIRWCDVSNYNQWTAAVTNQAGSFRLSNGSQIVGAYQTSLETLIWTDVDLWSMQYQGQPFIFGFQQLAEACGLINMRAATIAGNRVMWMGKKGFFQLVGGQVQPLQCSVWDIVFANLNTIQAGKIFCAANAMFSEVSWFFASASGSGAVDTYVKYNYAENVWDYGSLVRTAWTNVSVWGAPIGVDGSGLLQQHETSNDADGAVLDSWVESGDIDISNGEDFVFIDYLVFDALLTGTGTPSVNLTLKSRNFPNSAQLTQGPYTITSASTDQSPRLRGRQVSFRFETTGVGSFWRIGRCRYRYAPDGKHG